MGETRLLPLLGVAIDRDGHPVGEPELERLVADVLVKAREVWPGIDLPQEVFLPYLGARLADDIPLPLALPRTNASDLYLACACARGEAAAIAAFEQRCLSVVDQAVARLGGGPDLGSEVKQRLRQKLLISEGGPARITQFSGRGDLRGWVRVIAVREGLTLVREAHRTEPLDEGRLQEALLPSQDPELQRLKIVYRQAFRSAFDRALQSLSDHDRVLLRQTFLDGVTTEELATLYRVHRATAARWLERARDKVLRRTLALFEEGTLIGPGELDSVLRLIQSQLEVSTSALVQRRRPAPRR